MKQAFEIIAGMMDRFDKVEGCCDKHGPSTVLVGKGKEWHCDKCFEQALAIKSREEHMERMRAGLIVMARIPEKFIGQRFVAHTPEQLAVRKAAVGFRDAVLQEKRWASLILTGSVGTGKTLLACELASSMVEKFGLPVRYTTAKEMIGEICASYSTDGKTEEGEIGRFASYGLLIIDEIDAHRGKPNDLVLLTEVINRRYSNNRPVIAITNQPFEDLAQFVGDRVDSRLHENAFVCTFNWPDFRRNPVSEKLSAQAA